MESQTSSFLSFLRDETRFAVATFFAPVTAVAKELMLRAFEPLDRPSTANVKAFTARRK